MGGGYVKPTCKTSVAFGLLESRNKTGGIEMPSIDANPTKEEWGGFDGLEIRYSDKVLANTNNLSIHDTQRIFVVLEEHEEVDVKVCCVDSQSSGAV
ncbi:hypothetical protein VN0858_06460 [Helicobacter pylori]